MQKTTIIKNSDIKRDWYIFDASNYILGDLATKIAIILSGKNKASYSPHQDGGDYVVVINCDKINVSGKKMTDKLYRYHTSFFGGLKEVPFKDMLEKSPESVIKHAVYSMIPRNRLHRDKISRLKIYTGGEHPHKNITFKNA